MRIFIAVVVVATSFAALVYALLNVPRRYRWFGPGQSREAVDNSQGIFGRTYPEVPADDRHAVARVGRNDRCPCGSGKKYKHCHGESAERAT